MSLAADGLAADLAGLEKPEDMGSADVGPDGGEFKDIRSDEPITDWSHVFARFNLTRSR